MFSKRLLSSSSQTAAATVALFIVVVVAAAPAREAAAQAVNLDALQRDGYGMVPIKRPQPNTLAVDATINGKKVRLNLDTGWGDEGITLDQNYAASMRVATEPVKEYGRSASGAELTGVRRGRAETVLLGNVQMAGVPLFFGHFRALTDETIRRRTGINGFLGSGFLQTCSAVVDLHNLRLYLRPPGTGRRAVIGPALKASGLTEAPLIIRGHNVFVPVEINGVAAYMFVDTGAYLAGVDKRFVPKLKTAEFQSRVGSIDAAGVIRQFNLAKVREFKIAGVPVRAPDVRVGTYGFYGQTSGEVVGLLGMDILGKNGAIIDFGSKKMYFYPAQ
jgi:predicted aspartyl protease